MPRIARDCGLPAHNQDTFENKTFDQAYSTGFRGGKLGKDSEIPETQYSFIGDLSGVLLYQRFRDRISI